MKHSYLLFASTAVPLLFLTPQVLAQTSPLTFPHEITVAQAPPPAAQSGGDDEPTADGQRRRRERGRRVVRDKGNPLEPASVDQARKVRISRVPREVSSRAVRRSSGSPARSTAAPGNTPCPRESSGATPGSRATAGSSRRSSRPSAGGSASQSRPDLPERPARDSRSRINPVPVRSGRRHPRALRALPLRASLQVRTQLPRRPSGRPRLRRQPQLRSRRPSPLQLQRRLRLPHLLLCRSRSAGCSGHSAGCETSASDPRPERARASSGRPCTRPGWWTTPRPGRPSLASGGRHTRCSTGSRFRRPIFPSAASRIFVACAVSGRGRRATGHHRGTRQSHHRPRGRSPDHSS